MHIDPEVSIGNRLIGPNHDVYIIAEAGVNHNGDPARARSLIDAAKVAGADAVKFQVFSADRLVQPDAPTCAYQKSSGGQHELLRKLELTAQCISDLKQHADRIGIDFLATPFGVEEVQQLHELGVSAIKIASTDLVNTPLLLTAADTQRPIILSTGASLLPEIDKAVQLIRDRQTAERLILLHCVSAYPTQPAQARLRCIQTLARRFGVPTGFSDHTPDDDFSALAVAAGAVMLEKHLTLDRAEHGPDHFFSLMPDQFARYVCCARKTRASLGDGQLTIAPEEIEVRKLARGSLTARCAIPTGQEITSGLLTVRRPSGGIEPQRWDDVLGRRAKIDIPADAPLAWSMLQ
jgi:N-acetylneuraminate synthase/N,N'-diacetyllegionaminate synthase